MAKERAARLGRGAANASRAGSVEFAARVAASSSTGWGADGENIAGAEMEVAETGRSWARAVLEIPSMINGSASRLFINLLRG